MNNKRKIPIDNYSELVQEAIEAQIEEKYFSDEITGLLSLYVDYLNNFEEDGEKDNALAQIREAMEYILMKLFLINDN